MQPFEATDAESFNAAFERVAHARILEVVEPFVARQHVSAILLGGSIPLGIATKASDIDITVLIDSASAVDLEKKTEEGQIFFSARFNGSDRMVVATAVVRMGTIEVDLQFVVEGQIHAFMDRIEASKVTLSIQERRTIARMRTAWLLYAPPAAELTWMHAGTFEVRCATQSFINALRFYQDAKVARGDLWPLSLVMGRHAVERAFEAYFAKCGFGFLGFKWLRFLTRRWAHLTDDEGLLTSAQAQQGQTLLFPREDESGVETYLELVGDFIEAVRKTINHDLRFRLAFELSPHIASPRPEAPLAAEVP